MKTFATLVEALDSTNKTTRKLDALGDFLTHAEEKDKLWLLALFTGKRPKRPVSTTLLKLWAMEASQIPDWLFLESYTTVGDLGETIALLLPAPLQYNEQSLSEWMNSIVSLHEKTDEQKKIFVLNAWNQLAFTERFIFNKLIGGSFRLGVSAKLLIKALARHYDLDESAVAHSIMGAWQIDHVGFEGLVRGEYTNTRLSQPYPFCLAYALDKHPGELGNVEEWQIEYKWDGIRGQFIKRKEEVFIWSRGEELVTGQFPELVAAMETFPDGLVLDGEILVLRGGKVQDFSELQKRLNRKTVTRKMLDDYPIVVFVYDLIEWEGNDLRSTPLRERRKKLEEVIGTVATSRFLVSEKIEASNWEALQQIRDDSRERNSEGLMFKHLYSPYHSGRKRGDWWKWKIAPLTLDAVMIYAQKGSGRRSGYYTDYTFAVKDGDQLVTIAKAYSGLTDKEIQQVSRFVNLNAIEKFGPVRTVKPELVFEIAFEGIGFSNRHKSGIALRFPRISRWRKDKTVADIDTLEDVRKLIR